MTPFITEEEEKEIRPSIPTCEVGRWFPAFADITAKGDTKQKGIDEIIRYFDMKLEETMASVTEAMTSVCFAMLLSELPWDKPKRM